MLVTWIVQSSTVQLILLMALGVGGMFFAVMAAFTWRALRSGEIDLSDPVWRETLVRLQTMSWVGLVATLVLLFVVLFGGVW